MKLFDLFCDSKVLTHNAAILLISIAFLQSKAAALLLGEFLDAVVPHEGTLYITKREVSRIEC